MHLNDYPKALVRNAPGFGDFEGWLLVTFPAVDGRGDLKVVAGEWNGKIETHVFSHRHVTEL